MVEAIDLPSQNLALTADEHAKQEQRVERAVQNICATTEITTNQLLNHLLQKNRQDSAGVNLNDQSTSNNDFDDDQRSGESEEDEGLAAMERERSFDAVRSAVTVDDIRNVSKTGLAVDLSLSSSTSSGDSTVDAGLSNVDLVTSESSLSSNKRKRRSGSAAQPTPASRTSHKRPKTSQPTQKTTQTTQTFDWSAFDVPKRLTQFANRDKISVDETLTLVILGCVLDHHTHTRPNQTQIKKWKGIVSDGFIRMTAYFIAEDINVDLSQTLKHGQIISSALFSPLREEVNGDVTYCELRFIKYNTKGAIPFEQLPSDVSSISIFTSSTSTSTSGISSIGNSSSSTTPTMSNCCGVACSAALASAHEHDEPDANRPINVLDTCVATLALPSLSAMASLNSFYNPEKWPNPDNLPTHHKRQCVYYYFAVHHFDGRGVRVDLPCCVRKRIHTAFPCEDSRCSRLDCPTHCAAFQDAFGFPAAF